MNLVSFERCSLKTMIKSTVFILSSLKKKEKSCPNQAIKKRGNEFGTVYAVHILTDKLKDTINYLKSDEEYKRDFGF